MTEYQTESWQLRGSARQVAVFATATFLVGAFLAVVIDIVAANNWDAGTVQGWTLVPQLATAAGFYYLGKNEQSRSFTVMAVLVVVIIIEETFHVMNPLAVWLVDRARELSDWSGIRFGFLAVGLIYGVIAAIGFAMILLAYRQGTASERIVVRNMTLLLIVGGLFGGPIGAAGALGNQRRWLFIEEFGEAVVFALIAGYTAGLVRLSRSRQALRSR